MKEVLYIYVAIINLITFFVFAIDKQKAVNHRFRIREATLLALAAIGGSVGGLLAMYLYRHKTQKKKFTIGMPFILVIQILYLLVVRVSISFLY